MTCCCAVYAIACGSSRPVRHHHRQLRQSHFLGKLRLRSQEASYNADMIDKAAIFTELTRRNAIRRQAQLPLLDMRDEFDRAVEYARWKVVCEEHGDRVRREVITELSKTFGREPQSAGGRWAVNILTLKRLRALHQSST
jgi:hypothetical protein